MGAHYGLAEKFDILIYGGSKGHELDFAEGEQFAEAIFNESRSVIFDVSHWNDFQTQEFMASFLQKIFSLHSERKTPRHIFVEEAEVVFPQTGFDSSKLSLLAGNKIMKRGRSFGLGMTLITQRPQDVNKKTLSQSQCTFILHMEGLQEMEVVNKMLRNIEKDKRQTLLKRIVEFKQGECMLYSPAWLNKIEEFKFRKRETYHAGDTPELNKVIVEPTLKSQQPLIVGIPKSAISEEETLKPSPFLNTHVMLLIAIIFASLLGFALGF